jgi:uncharacterized protein (DUF2267 family)
VLVRGIYLEGWDPLLSPATERKKRDFIIRVERSFGFETNVSAIPTWPQLGARKPCLQADSFRPS